MTESILVTNDGFKNSSTKLCNMVRTAQYRCSHDSCTRVPGLNTEGCKKPVICKHHDEGGMVRVNDKRFGHVSCITISTLNIESGKTTIYCEQHAVDGIVHVFKRGCAHASSKIGAFFNVEGSEKAANGSNMSRTAWSTSVDAAAHMTLVVLDRASTLKETRRRCTPSIMLKTVW